MDITQLLILFIAILAALCEAYVIPWIKSKIEAERLAELLEFAKMGVLAAEQMMSTSTGAEKKAYVVEYLESKGLKFDEDVVNAAIEAAVLEMNKELLGE